MIAIGRLCVGLALAAGCVGTVRAQPAPQSDSEFHITAWAPKAVDLPPYVGVNRATLEARRPSRGSPQR